MIPDTDKLKVTSESTEWSDGVAAEGTIPVNIDVREGGGSDPS